MEKPMVAIMMASLTKFGQRLKSGGAGVGSLNGLMSVISENQSLVKPQILTLAE